MEMLLQTNVSDTFERLKAIAAQYCSVEAAAKINASLPEFSIV
jgi:3-methyladenine DNA glycosylase/8-oxoguanine DNA glycosylase